MLTKQSQNTSSKSSDAECNRHILQFISPKIDVYDHPYLHEIFKPSPIHGVPLLSTSPQCGQTVHIGPLPRDLRDYVPLLTNWQRDGNRKREDRITRGLRCEIR